MEDIKHGGDIYSLQGVLDFSANINPLGLCEGVREAIKNSADLCVHYPDPLCRRLKQSISGFEGVGKEMLVCGNGAADLIYRLVHALRPGRALIAVPAFLEYEDALNEAGCRVTFYNLSAQNGFELDEGFLAAADGGFDMIFICNPSNPTGLLADPQLLRRLLAVCKRRGTLLVLDECFIDFVDRPDLHTLKPYLHACPNLFLLKAFTKIFAMPGIRLGYGICADEALIQKVSQCGQTWSVSVVAQQAGVSAVREKSYLEESRQVVRRQRIFLKTALAEMGFEVYDSAANFIFFRARGSRALADRLKEDGILIRSCANYRGLGKEYYRVAVRLQDENEQLVRTLKKHLKER
jgi:threonine-phosphate decarboxylase